MEDGDMEIQWGDTRFCIFESEKGSYQVYFFSGI